MNFLLYMLEGNMKVVFIWDQLFWVDWVFSCCPIAQNVLLFPVDKDFLTLFWLKGSVFQTVLHNLSPCKNLPIFTVLHIYHIKNILCMVQTESGCSSLSLLTNTVPSRLDFTLDLFQCGMRFCWKVLMQNKGIMYHVDLLSLLLNYCQWYLVTLFK